VLPVYVLYAVHAVLHYSQEYGKRNTILTHIQVNSQKNMMSAMFLMTSCHQDEMTLFASQHFSQLGQIVPSFGSYGCTCALYLKSNNTDRVWCQGISRIYKMVSSV